MRARGVPERVVEALSRFVERVVEALGSDTMVYLFGSYARGDWLRDSDIDLVVVSPRFRGLSLGERYVLVRSLFPSDVSVDLLLYTPEEFERMVKKSIILRDAMEYWIRLV